MNTTHSEWNNLLYIKWSKYLTGYFIRHGLSDSEIKYVINAISNKVRRYDDGCLHAFRVSVDDSDTDEYEDIRRSGGMRQFDFKITTRSSKKVVQYGFSGSD